MERGGPLQRKTPMSRGSAPLKRVAPAKIPQPRTPQPRNRPAPRPTGPPLAIRALCFTRDRSLCIRCGAPATNLQHREGRGMGGRQDPAERARVNSPAYLLSLCGSGTTGCHGWVETNRTEARELGYATRRNSPTDPATVPVLTVDGWQLFLDDGTRIPTTAPQETP